MKQLFFVFVIIGIIMPLAGRLIAQNTSANLLTEMAISSSKSPGDILAAEKINPRARRLFEKEFKNAQNVKWLQLKDGQLAGFTENETRYAAYYYTNGRKAGLIKGYTADKLQREIREMLEYNYPGYAITYVNEVCAAITGYIPVFVVNLLGVNDTKVIKVCEGETVVVFDSSKPNMSIERF